MCDKYVIGSGPPPEWCAESLIAYQKTDGTVGYEFHGYRKDFELESGDVLLKSKRGIEIKKKV